MRTSVAKNSRTILGNFSMSIPKEDEAGTD